jgi:hypothetical protein
MDSRIAAKHARAPFLCLPRRAASDVELVLFLNEQLGIEETDQKRTRTSNFVGKRLNLLVHPSNDLLELLFVVLLARNGQIEASAQLHDILHRSLQLRIDI